MLLTNTIIRQRGTSRQLVVVLHAWTMSSAKIVDVVNAVEDTMPDADLLVPDYPAGVFSNADPIRISEELVSEIDNAVKSRR